MTTATRDKISKKQRREDAEERQARWDTLSNEEKLEVIASRPGNSAKERKKIEKKIAKSKK